MFGVAGVELPLAARKYRRHTAAPTCDDDAMEDVDPTGAHESRELDEVVERLLERFPKLPADRVRSAVTKAHESFAGNPIRDFVPVFVERSASDELRRIGAVTTENQPL
jgi:hypothetical protein